MDNRYSRHGPRAWLRQRMHRYARFSVVPAPVVSPLISPTTIIRIFVPTTTERVIFIIMSDENAQEAWGNPGSIQMPESQMRYLVASPRTTLDQDTGAIQKVLPIWERIAIRDASDDIDDIKDLQEKGCFVLIEEKLFERRIKSLAKKATDDYVKDPTVSLGHEALRKGYQEAYLRTFEEREHLIQEKLIEIKDTQEERLRAILIKDRPSVQSRNSGDWHARDLVLVRILQIYYPDSLEDIDIISVLLERHALIDRYEKFVHDSDGKNEVIWPDPDSFRLTN